MAKVVVMGAGLGGVACAYEMKKKLGKAHEVTMVGSSAFFEFTPSNPWILVGWRTAPQTRVDLAEPLADKDVRFVPKMVESIDAPGSTLKLADGSTLAYDYLVITTGPKLAFEEVPVVAERGQHVGPLHLVSRLRPSQSWIMTTRPLDVPRPWPDSPRTRAGHLVGDALAGARGRAIEGHAQSRER